MTEDSGKDTRIVPVKGRSVVVRMLNDAQLILMSREAKIIQQAGTDGPRKMLAASRLYDMLESVVVQESDREYLTDLVIKGNLELTDMMGFVTAFQEDDGAEEEKPRVRRGRPAKRT